MQRPGLGPRARSLGAGRHLVTVPPSGLGGGGDCRAFWGHGAGGGGVGTRPWCWLVCVWRRLFAYWAVVVGAGGQMSFCWRSSANESMVRIVTSGVDPLSFTLLRALTSTLRIRLTFCFFCAHTGGQGLKLARLLHTTGACRGATPV